MTGVDELDLYAGDARQHGHWSVVADGLKPIERASGIDRCVQRQGGRVLRVPMTVCLTRILLLDMRRVGQHERAQVLRARRAEHTPAEPLRDQPRQIAAVVEMRVGEHDRIDARRIDRERRPVAEAQLLQPLKQATVDEDAMLAKVEEMF